MSFELFDLASAAGAEQVSFAADPSTGLRAVVAVHSTVLGPALGGTRFYPYVRERAAFVDVLRLAQGMTYKHAIAGNRLGGGKGVIIGDPATLRTDDLIRGYGRFVDRLGGRYLTAEDVGTTTADMDLIRTVTRYVTGVSVEAGGSGDPSPATAWGVLHSMCAVAERLWGDDSLEGRRVVVSGVGKVGMSLVGHLRDRGVHVAVADVRPAAVADAVERYGATAVDVETAPTVECDIFSPCALGAVLDQTTIPALRCAAVCGAANNQLAEPEDAHRLAARGILYAPDYVANAGGVINIHGEALGEPYDRDAAFAQVERIRDTLLEIFQIAEAKGLTTAEAADHLAEDRIAAAGASAAATSGGEPDSAPSIASPSNVRQ
ncbi:MAG: Glu/Leu/Phe/Val family dehydrogenase [Acidimicrobiales bacterium]